MDELDGHRALADRGGHALDRAVPHVAGDEDAGHARLEQVRVAVERPAGRPVAVRARRRGRARRGRSRARRARPGRRATRSPGCAPMKMKRWDAGTVSVPSASRIVSVSRWSLPAASTTCGARADGDVRDRRDLLDQVVRHALRERVGADEHRHAAGEAREVDRRLAGRVRAADDVHLLLRAVASPP